MANRNSPCQRWLCRFWILDSDASATDQSKIVRTQRVPDAHAEVKNLKSKIDATGLTEFAAIELFCQRARAVKPDFVLTPGNAAEYFVIVHNHEFPTSALSGRLAQ